LKKEELKNSEDYYRDYLFVNLEDLYQKQTNNYMALKMKAKAEENKLAYVSFLEYEYETHYKFIALAYDTLARIDSNSSKSMKSELNAIKYIKRAVETEWGELKEENNNILYRYMENLEEYIESTDSNEVKNLETYLSYVDSFEKFEESTFGGEESNHAELAKSYNFIANVYKVSDINKSKKYAEKSVDFIEKSIVEFDDSYDDKKNKYSNSLDKYYADLWDIYSLTKVDTNSSIDKYFDFKKKYYEKGSQELVNAYETVGSFFMNHTMFDNAIEYYKQALDEAVLKNKENKNIYLIESDISILKDISLNKEMVDIDKTVKLLNELIVWQEKNYDDKYSLAKSYEALGQIYSENNNSIMVEKSYHKAMDMYYNYIEENNESYGILASLRDVYEKLSIYYAKHNNKEKAIKNFEMFIAYAEKKFPDDKEELSENYRVFANVYDVMKDEEMAKKCREKSKEI
jgi:tetratricopeptide (TPR) repeat protein